MGGSVVTLEAREEWAKVGVRHWEQAGVRDRIDLRVGVAVDTLDQLLETEEGTFDLCFVDADKPNYRPYYERCLRLLRPGGIIALDNVLWNGAVIDDQAFDPETRALRELNSFVHADDRVAIVMLPVGDGLTLATKKRR